MLSGQQEDFFGEVSADGSGVQLERVSTYNEVIISTMRTSYTVNAATLSARVIISLEHIRKVSEIRDPGSGSRDVSSVVIRLPWGWSNLPNCSNIFVSVP